MPRLLAACLMGLVVVSHAVAGLAAEDPPAEAVLKEKGLRKAGAVYVLADEAEVQKKMTEARAIYKQMTNALIQQQAYEQGLQDSKQYIRQLTEQRIGLNQQLSQAATAAQHNQIVGVLNEVTDRLNLLRQEQADPESKRPLDARAAQGREAYVQAVLDLRQLVDAANASYAALAAAPDIKGALEQLNAKSKIKVSLGPSKAYLANVKMLEKVESSVLSESVDLRKEGGIFWVDVTFNGKVTKPMAFDTGAADVVLPADFAAEIGLKPGPDTPTVRCRVADGSIVEAKQMTVPSMRVGKFTVKDVSCVVMPADKADVPPLLGQTFQKNFMFKFSADTGKLVLSKVDTPEVAGAAAAKPKPTPKASSRTTARPRAR